jgi:hypothetical protein
MREEVVVACYEVPFQHSPDGAMHESNSVRTWRLCPSQAILDSLPWRRQAPAGKNSLTYNRIWLKGVRAPLVDDGARGNRRGHRDAPHSG